MKIAIIAHHAKDLLNFQGHFLNELLSLGHEVYTCLPKFSSEMEAKYSELGLKYVPYSLERTGMNPLNDVKTYRNLCRLMKKIQPDLVFTTAIKPNIYGCLAAKKAGVPNIYTMVQGLGFAFRRTGFKSKLAFSVARTMYKKALDKNRSVFFLNPDDLGTFVDLNLIKKDQAVLINGVGVDIDYFSPAPIVPNPPTFLLISRLIRDKGIGEFVEAASLLRKKYPEPKFRILGPLDSNPSAISESQIQQWHDQGIIEYCGVTTDVRPFIASSNVFVLPTYYNEGLPRSIIEAMAMSRPVITTDSPGCRETVEEGLNGYLIPVKNTQALAESMEKFIKMPDTIQTMGDASRKIAVDKFDVNKVNAKILSVMGLKE